MIVDRKRKPNFQTYKCRTRGKGQAFLLYAECSKGYARLWDIPLEYGGKLAQTPPPLHTLRPIGLRSLCPESAEQVRECIAYIEKNGDPIQNDESKYKEVR